MIGMAIRSFHLGLDRNTDIDRNMCDGLYPPKYDQIQHVRSGTHQRSMKRIFAAKTYSKNSNRHQNLHQVLADRPVSFILSAFRQRTSELFQFPVSKQRLNQRSAASRAVDR